MNSRSLSAECLTFIESLDLDFQQQYPSEEDRNATVVLREITRRILASREGFAGKEIEVLEGVVKNAPDLVLGELDDFLTRLLLEEVSGMAVRVVKLSRLDAPNRPSQATSVYIQEAARTYIYGFPQASVAISRAALEQALKERLGRQGAGEFITYQDFVAEATKWKILDNTTARMVRDTAKKADAVLHEEPTDQAGALEVLTEARALLQQIYSAQGGS